MAKRGDRQDARSRGPLSGPINAHRPGAGLGVLPDGAKSQKRGGSQAGGGAGQILGRSTRYSGTGQLGEHNILGGGGGQGAFGFLGQRPKPAPNPTPARGGGTRG